ncbi:hypothetical protein D3C78_1311670 [compost metagenome]
MLDATEQSRQLAVVTQVAITDDVQRTADHQRFAGLLEHAPGEEVADHLLLVERRIAQYDFQRLCRLASQAIVGTYADFTLAQRRLPVFQRRLGGHVGLINQGVVGLRVAQGTDDSQHAITATQIGDPG